MKKQLRTNHTEALEKLIPEMDIHSAWDYDTTIKQILSELKIDTYDKKIGQLSGGQKKRVGLAKVLISNPDFLILDEPTNHLDIEMTEWLEEYLGKSNATLLMVTHDRYFLGPGMQIRLSKSTNSVCFLIRVTMLTTLKKRGTDRKPQCRHRQGP